MMSSLDVDAGPSRSSRPVARAELHIVAAQWPPAGASGDIFHVHDHPDGSVTAVVADVSGNGSEAAPLGAHVRALARRELAQGASPAGLLGSLNEVLEREVPMDRFVSALAVRIEPGRRRLCVASAGHLGPFVMPARGAAARVVWPAGFPLGVMAAHRYDEVSLGLSLDDTIVLATDGVTDRFATTTDPLGETALLEELRASDGTPASVCQRLARAAADAGRGDFTVVAVRVGLPSTRSPRRTSTSV